MTSGDDILALMRLLGQQVPTQQMPDQLPPGVVDARNAFPRPEVVPENPIPISQDPWFDEQLSGFPPYDGVGSPGQELEVPGRQSQRGLREAGQEFQRQRDLGIPSGIEGQPAGDDFDLMSFLGQQSASQPGEFYLWAKGTNGKLSRADGPFKSEIEAMRALNSYREQGTKLDLAIGPADGPGR